MLSVCTEICLSVPLLHHVSLLYLKNYKERMFLHETKDIHINYHPNFHGIEKTTFLSTTTTHRKDTDLPAKGLIKKTAVKKSLLTRVGCTGPFK